MDKSKKKFLINTISTYSSMLINLVISFFLTPYLIRNLGVAAYGLYPLATSIVSYLDFLTISLNNSIGRYLAVFLEQDDQEEANYLFNTSFSLSIFIILLTIPIGFALVFFIPNLLSIPEGQELNSRILFGIVWISFIVTTFRISFGASSWAKSRFDLRTIQVTTGQLAKVGIILALFTLLTPSIWQVGLGLLGYQLVLLLIEFPIWKHLTPRLSINFRQFRKQMARKISSMSGWLIVNQIGDKLNLSADLVLINIFFGSTQGGIYGSFLLFSNVLRELALRVSNIIAPLLVGKFALGKTQNMMEISRMSEKFLGLFVALPAGIICGLARPLLSLWLGPEFAQQAFVLFLIVFLLPINLAAVPLFGIQTAMLKVKVPGIATILFGLFNIGFAILLIKTTTLGMIAVAVASITANSLKNVFFTTLYSARIQNMPWYTFLKPLIPTAIATIFVIGLSYSFTLFIAEFTWVSFILACILSVGISALFIYFLLFTKEERQFLLGFIPWKDKKKLQTIG